MTYTEKIIKMYKDLGDPAIYCGDDIATVICNKLLNRDKMSGNEEYFRKIKDIFDTCQDYINSTYEEENNANI